MKAGRLAGRDRQCPAERRDGHLVGHIAQDIGFEAFNCRGCYFGTFPTKERARRALEKEPLKCEHC